MGKFRDYREESRTKWGTSELKEADGLSIEHINLGCMLRIADASELMAKNHQRLINDVEMYKRWYNEEREENARLRKSNSGLKGWVTRLKGDLAWLKEINGL